MFVVEADGRSWYTLGSISPLSLVWPPEVAAEAHDESSTLCLWVSPIYDFASYCGANRKVLRKSRRAPADIRIRDLRRSKVLLSGSSVAILLKLLCESDVTTVVARLIATGFGFVDLLNVANVKFTGFSQGHYKFVFKNETNRLVKLHLVDDFGRAAGDGNEAKEYTLTIPPNCQGIEAPTKSSLIRVTAVFFCP